MTEFTQSEDQALDTVINNFGGNVRAGVVRVKELIDQYQAMPFNTRKASGEDIRKSFELLHQIYVTALSAPSHASIAAIQYLTRRFAEGRQTIFNPVRVNMMPNVEQGGSKSSLRFITDMNQLFGTLTIVSNADQLRSRMRLEPVLNSVRSESQRNALLQYISTIDH